MKHGSNIGSNTDLSDLSAEHEKQVIAHLPKPAHFHNALSEILEAPIPLTRQWVDNFDLTFPVGEIVGGSLGENDVERAIPRQTVYSSGIASSNSMKGYRATDSTWWTT
jgi:aspartyl/asparaginyl-tRNA synthetase